MAINAEFMNIEIDRTGYIVDIYEVSDTVKYVGIAPRGSATSDAKWQIKKYTQVDDGGVTKTTMRIANKGIDTLVMDNYATYTYA